MGAVYEARDLRLERIVAVKILRGRAFGRADGAAPFPPRGSGGGPAQSPAHREHLRLRNLEGEGAYIVTFMTTKARF
jgi:hypothetical protein